VDGADPRHQFIVIERENQVVAGVAAAHRTVITIDATQIGQFHNATQDRYIAQGGGTPAPRLCEQFLLCGATHLQNVNNVSLVQRHQSSLGASGVGCSGAGPIHMIELRIVTDSTCSIAGELLIEPEGAIARNFGFFRN
jgi:hypothetical protein